MKQQLSLSSIFFVFIFFPILLGISFFAGCGRPKEPLSRTGFYFDTAITISLYDKREEKLLEQCFSMARSYENLFSKTVENSDVWNINHGNGHPVLVSDDTLALLRAALSYARLTDGKIDPTIGPVTQLWDFSSSSDGLIPSQEDLAEALSHVGYERVLIEGNTVCLLDPQAEIDLGFIAKGYIADRLKEYLLSQGVKSATINLGGNVLAIGRRPDNTPFRIGIQKPFAPEGTIALALPITDLSVVSSGIYERYFEKDNTIYHHILDTKTGYPVQNNLFEVTILSQSSMDGDALSTTCFLLGIEDGMALIESLENTEAVFLTSDGSVHASSGLDF
ncbi:FAD:protein FMN transferase [Lachnospiraceae bacterium]|nr:FAD:protein FMN transferase [Lachnospiraceae bacterium]